MTELTGVAPPDTACRFPLSRRLQIRTNLVSPTYHAHPVVHHVSCIMHMHHAFLMHMIAPPPKSSYHSHLYTSNSFFGTSHLLRVLHRSAKVKIVSSKPTILATPHAKQTSDPKPKPHATWPSARWIMPEENTLYYCSKRLEASLAHLSCDP